MRGCGIYLCALKGSRLYRIVAENITGSCGMIPSLALQERYESILESVAEGVSESN